MDGERGGGTLESKADLGDGCAVQRGDRPDGFEAFARSEGPFRSWVFFHAVVFAVSGEQPVTANRFVVLATGGELCP